MLYAYRIVVAPFVNEDGDLNPTGWSVSLTRAGSDIAGFAVGTFAEALKAALDVRQRRQWSPSDTPIPPKNVRIVADAGWLPPDTPVWTGIHHVDGLDPDRLNEVLTDEQAHHLWSQIGLAASPIEALKAVDELRAEGWTIKAPDADVDIADHPYVAPEGETADVCAVCGGRLERHDE